MPSTTKHRRERGYSFETWLVNKFNKTENWKAKRLGGSSVALPDVIAVNNVNRILYAIEAKSKRGNSVEIPLDQIERCQEMAGFFGVYTRAYSIIAVRLGENRKPKYGFYDIDPFAQMYLETGKVIKAIVAFDNLHHRLEFHFNNKSVWRKDDEFVMPFSECNCCNII